MGQWGYAGATPASYPGYNDVDLGKAAMPRVRAHFMVHEFEEIRIERGRILPVRGEVTIEHPDAGPVAVDAAQMKQKLKTVSHSTPSGGARQFLECRQCRCPRRALYRPGTGHYWACRECWSLTYITSQMHDARVNDAARGKTAQELLQMHLGDFPSEHVMWRALLLAGAIDLGADIITSPILC
jgi:hypothetical protein